MREIRCDSHTRSDEDLIEAFEIGKLAHKTARTLSGGMRQKLSACLAFLFDPEILILDEPTAGLDPLAAEILKEKVRTERAKNKLILLTSHILSDLDEITSDVLYLIDGRIRFYRPIAELFEKSMAMIALNPIDLGRVVVLLQMDVSALMGYTGALIKDLLGTTAGIASAAGILSLWMLVPLGLACWIFRKKDL